MASDKRPIKLFFSWQSDLPACDTKQLIINVLDEIAKDGYVISDRDTKGEAGSPTIDEVIFRKIDECDVFVADISIINKKFVDKQKELEKEQKDGDKDPDEKDKRSVERLVINPNVMLELGYAASTKGWDNICLLFNTEYGDKDSLPFDLRQHRIADFSTKKTEDISKRKTKENAQKTIREAVEEQIRLSRLLPQRAKRGFSFFVVGGFNGEEVESIVKEYIIKNNPIIDRHIEKCCEEASRIIEQIEEIKVEKKEEEPVSPLRYYDSMQEKLRKATISDSAKEVILQSTKRYLNKELDEDFFNLGGLIKNEYLTMVGVDELQGTDDEKEKHKLLNDLIYQFKLIDLIKELVEMFDDVSLVPLAIHNKSNISDSSIKINVHVENACIIDEDNMSEFVRKNGGYVFDKGFIADLFHVKKVANISYDKDITVNDSDRMRALKDAHPFSNAKHSVKDMLQEIQKYVATFLADGIYQFKIDSLHANEIKWLGPMIAVKRSTKPIIIEYEVLSQKSDGTVSGSCVLEA